MLTPPTLSLDEFKEVLDRFRDLLGAEHVMVDGEGMERYRDPHGPRYDTEEESHPCCALRPSTVEELRGILGVANRYRIPLWTISRGRNFGYGGPSAVVGGSAIIDLGRMNRILEINEKHAYAVVEPGVSRQELWAEIQKRGYALWQDGPSSPLGSVVGSTSEKGIGYGLLGDRMSSFCGMEVVLPDGDVVRTGMGAMTGAETWQQYRWGFGPWVDGIFAQSNYGIITKLGIWLCRQPPCFRSAEVYVQEHVDLVPMIDTLRELRLTRVIENSASGAPNYGGHHEGGIGPGGGTGAIAGALPGWRIRLGFYGHERIVDAKWEQAWEAFSGIAGATFHERKFHAPYDYADWSSESKLAAGVISPDEYPHWDHGVVFTSVVVPFDGESFLNLIRKVGDLYRSYGFEYFGGPFHVHTPRALIALITAPLSGGMMEMLGRRKIDNRRVIEMKTRLMSELAALGAGTYRASVGFMDHAAGTFDFNHHAQLRLQERLKDALDPQGILMPGKYGIWPKRMRT